MIRALSLVGMLLGVSVSAANATVLFSDPLNTNDLGNTSIWSSNGSGAIVAAPTAGPAGANALTFTRLGSGGDLFFRNDSGNGGRDLQHFIRLLLCDRQLRRFRRIGPRRFYADATHHGGYGRLAGYGYRSPRLSRAVLVFQQWQMDTGQLRFWRDQHCAVRH